MTPLEELLRSTLRDPALGLPPEPGTIDAALRRRGSLRSRRQAITATVAAGALAIGAGAVLLSGLDAQHRKELTARLVRPSPTATGLPDLAVRRIRTSAEAVAGLAMDRDAVYVLDGPNSTAGPSIQTVERSSGVVVRRQRLPGEPTALAVGSTVVWVAAQADMAGRGLALLQLDRRTLAVGRTLHFDDAPQALAVAGSTLWAGAPMAGSGVDGTALYQLDGRTGRVLHRITLERPFFKLAVNPAAHALWVVTADELHSTLVALDDRTGAVIARRTMDGVRSLAPAGDSLWVVDSADPATQQLRRLDPRTLADRTPADLRSRYEGDLAVWPGAKVLWVSDLSRGELSCVDPVSGRVLGTRRLQTGTLVADAAALYASTGEGLVQIAPSSVCGG